MKVYEAKTLVSAMEKRARQYENLKGQVNHLKNQFLDIANSGDEFQGKGAEVIKGFYSAQADVAEAWIRLIDKNIAFFKGVEGDTEDAKLSGSTFVQLPFLEENIPRARDRAREMVEGQQNALKSILHSIDDLISLPVFSADAFEDHMAKAEKERRQTVDAVNQLDQTLTAEYAISDNDQHYLTGLFGQLLESSRQGTSITPLHFDAKAYKNSDIYKMKSDIENSSKEYLTFKAEQAEARKQMKIVQELEARPWYEKVWDTTKTFTGEVSGYYDYKRAIEGVDPVTGEKLTEAQRITAGAMATAGVIPVVGWAGRAFKGGSAIYKSVKAYNAADHALDAYKTPKSFSTLQKTEMGIYGLVSSNGLGEAVLGKDMFGNQLSDQQRQQSLMQALGILGVGGAAYGWDKLAAKNGNMLPFSNQYVNRKIESAHAILRDVGKRVGSVRVPIPVPARQAAGMGMNMLPGLEYRSLSEIVAWARSSSAVRGTSYTLEDYLEKIVVNGNVDTAVMTKLKNAIQNNSFSVDELSEIRKKMSELGITKEYNEALIKIDFGKYLKKLIGPPPLAMINPHAHHILFKKGLGETQQKLVQEGQDLLRRYGIDPIIGKENLVWAPNAVTGQHSLDALENVVSQLKAVEAEGGDSEDIIEVLEELGILASRR
ncbi:T7SS effector LXG polymorphic toxin [Metabacillus idriensis]|uniref:T7SS effector LXG polymorphic toxin n=1 Tax=Metabacillus idriensis TaxID=324768 RepID=UPI003D287FD0